MFTNKDQREIQRKLRIFRHADEIGHVANALGAPLRWRAFEALGT